MCGIAGFWSHKPFHDKSWFDTFVDALQHRGPDGRGVILFDESRLLFGHRRLSILDTSAMGSQPMVCANTGRAIIFNGEIYNFLEIRKQLIAFGYRFRTDTDTEVILAAYDRWGEDCQKKFNGMWAFAIWDSHEKKLFLSRDRFGVKPLFYQVAGSAFVFGSELKAFLKLPEALRPSIDPGMVALGDTFESAKKTILTGVFNLHAGHQLVIQRDFKPVITRWWRTSEHLESVPTNYHDQIERFRELFFDACSIRLRSDVALGTALSGGMDSSAVICAMASIQRNISGINERRPSDWRKAFVLDYTGTAHSERKYAEEVIRFVGADPIIKEVNLDSIDPCELEKSIFDFEGIQQPSLGPWLIYREMRRNGIFVSLDGHGGDELLGGYFHYSHPAMMDGLFRRSGTSSWQDIQSVHDGLYQAEDVPDGCMRINVPSKSAVLINEIATKGSFFANRFLSRAWKFKRFARKAKNKILGRKTIDFWKQPPADPDLLKVEHVPGFDRLNQALYEDFHFGMLPNILRNFDRLSMAHGVESRAPLLDWRLVTYCFSLPSNTKWGGGFTKRILRDAMNGHMPENIRTRKSKIGFASPMRKWLAGPLKTYVLDIASCSSFKNSEIWSGKALKKFIEDAYKNSAYESLERAWFYIQAHVVLTLLK